MSLSNMRREPRREIIETMIGLVFFGLFVTADYRFALFFRAAAANRNDPVLLPLGFLVGVVCSVVIALAAIGAVLFVHWSGEVVCDLMAHFGMDPRPTRRRA